MADNEQCAAARAQESALPISTVMHLASEGLVLGAGTLLVAADAARRLSSLKGQEARLLALLSAAYNRAVPPSVLGNIEPPRRVGGKVKILWPTSTSRMRVCPSSKTRARRRAASFWPTD